MTATQTRAPTSSYHLFTGASGASAITVRSLLTRLLMLVLSFFALLIVATLLVAFSPTLSRSLTSFFVKTQSGAVAWNGTDPVNMVVVGLDERPGMAGQFPHTDTMMVVSILPGSGSVRMLSIPRDLWVTIPGVGPDRVNDAYGYGGTKKLIRTAESIVNMPIRYYAIIKFTGFQKVIDAAGGVTIDVKRRIDDPFYPAPTGYGYAPLHIRAGVQHMNGQLALEYVRTRHDDPLGDLGRNQRQQQLLVALKQQMLRPTTLINLPGILAALGQAVDTNFPYPDLTYLARLVMTAPKSHVHRSALNYANNAVSNYTTAGGADVLLPNWPRIHWIARQTFQDPDLASRPIAVLNGSGMPGAAAQAAAWMRASGFDVTQVANAASSGYTQTHVIKNNSRGGGDFVARMAGDLLGAHVTAQSLPYSQPVVVIVGRDWVDPRQF